MNINLTDAHYLAKYPPHDNVTKFVINLWGAESYFPPGNGNQSSSTKAGNESEKPSLFLK
jgi:hypothetical protein